jgi:membrane-associated phospholipid phosphatase
MLHYEKILLYSSIFLVCFLFVAFFRSNFNSVNLAVNLRAASLNTGFFTLPAKAISVAFDTVALIIVTLAVAGVLFVLHRRRYSFLLLGAMAGDALLVDVCKTIIGSARPLNEIITETNFSFPSGHVSGTVVFFGILIYFTWKHWKTSKIKILTGILYVFVTAIVSFG